MSCIDATLLHVYIGAKQYKARRCNYIASQFDVIQDFTCCYTQSNTAEYSGSRFSVTIIVFQRSANAIVETKLYSGYQSKCISLSYIFT